MTSILPPGRGYAAKNPVIALKRRLIRIEGEGRQRNRIADAEKAVAAVTAAITDALCAGDKVQLVGFGTFEVRNREARQIVDHKHVTVNGKQVNIPSYLVKAGDVIEIKEKCKSMQRYKDIVEVTGGRLVPEWLDCDMEALKGTVKELPAREVIDVPVNEMLIVELYSK